MEHEIILDSLCIVEPANEIRFFLENAWFLAMTKKGFIFNREAFPTGTPKEFADRFVEILEQSYNISFTKRTNLESLS